MAQSNNEQTKIYESCLNILKHTSPKDTNQNLDNLIHLLHLQQDKEAYQTIKNKLYKNVLLPLKIEIDTLSDGKQFIACEYNKIGNRYRSPVTNKYFPPKDNHDKDDLPKPSKFARDLEVLANEIFQSYRKLYYGRDDTNTVSSVYFWNSDNDMLASGAFLIYKKVDDSEYVHGNGSSYWNSIHVVDIYKPESKKDSKELLVEYKVSTTIYLSLQPKVEMSASSNTTNLSGILNRNNTNVCPYNKNNSEEDKVQNHIINIGKMIEDIEIDLRTKMDQLYIQKLNEIMENIKYPKHQPSRQMSMPIIFGSKKNGNTIAVVARAPSFNIGAMAAAKKSSSEGTCASSSKKKFITSQQNNHLMRNHSMLLNEAILKRNKKQSN